MNLSEKIRKYRKEKNMTQSELSKKIGISCRALQNYENGSRIPPLQVKLKLADIFNIPMEELEIQNLPGLYILPRPDINDILPGSGKLKEKRDCIIYYLGKMKGMLQSGKYDNEDMEIVLNTIYELYTKRSSSDILKEFIESLNFDYSVKDIDDNTLNDILKKVSDVIELELYKLNK